MWTGVRIESESIGMATITTFEPETATRRVVDEPLYEVVNGRKVELPPMAAKSNHIKSRLGRYLGNHAESENLGHVEVETLFVLDPEADTRRRPDVAFVSFDRWPRDREVPAQGDWPVIPDLIVEVVSTWDLAEVVMEKILEYFEVGVRMVWVVYPRTGAIHVFDSFTSIRVVAGDQVLDGGPVVPGFQLSLAKLFG